jgi:hypothetical protein
MSCLVLEDPIDALKLHGDAAEGMGAGEGMDDGLAGGDDGGIGVEEDA